MPVRSFARVQRLGVPRRLTGSGARRLDSGVHGAASRPTIAWRRPLPPAWSQSRIRKWSPSATLVGWVLLALAAAATAVTYRASWLTQPAIDSVQKLGLAAAVGLSLTAVQRVVSRGRTAGRSLERAQVLLAVAGALTMLLVDNSLARAFGVAGVASVVRFRTPVEDPGDTTVLFLAMGLGMCSGVGAFTLAIVGLVVVAGVLLIARTRVAQAPHQALGVEVVSTGGGLTLHDIDAVFAGHGVHAEVAEWKQNGEVRARFRAVATSGESVDLLARDLRNCPGVASVTCEVRKAAC